MTAEQQATEDVHYEEAAEENLSEEQETQQVAEEVADQEPAKIKNNNNASEDRSGFIHGLAVGLGIGCIATFVVMWITIFFTPMVPPATTYETLLSIFIYPLIYLLAVGLIALTAGIVREYYSIKRKF